MQGKAAQGQAQLASVRGEGYSPARGGKDQSLSSTNPCLVALQGQRDQRLTGASASARQRSRDESTVVKRGALARTGERGHVRQG